MKIDSSFETGRILGMRGSRQVQVKVVLFQLRGCGHPQDTATPNFFPNSKGSLLGLLNEVSNFSLLQFIEKKIGIIRNQSCVPCGY